MTHGQGLASVCCRQQAKGTPECRAGLASIHWGVGLRDAAAVSAFARSGRMISTLGDEGCTTSWKSYLLSSQMSFGQQLLLWRELCVRSSVPQHSFPCRPFVHCPKFCFDAGWQGRLQSLVRMLPGMEAHVHWHGTSTLRQSPSLTQGLVRPELESCTKAQEVDNEICSYQRPRTHEGHVIIAAHSPGVMPSR